MDRTQLNVRINEGLAQELDKESDQTGRSKTWIVSAALSDYLDLPHEARDMQALSDKVDALEAKIKDITNSGEPSRTKTSVDYSDSGDAEPKNDELINPDDLPELITEKQAAAMTGYSTSTLSSKRSKHDIYAKKRVDGNRAGLYSKKEILSRIGIK